MGALETSAIHGCDYEVFLSFRGPDTRASLTDHLHMRLLDAGVNVFIDDSALRVGENIEREIFAAIRSSRILIPIISKQYAQSTWCLRELTEMMDCRSRLGKLVLPLFYKVDVVDLGSQRGDFDENLCKHGMQRSSEELPRWRKALTSVARIRGWISQTDGREGELVQMVVAKVLCELKTTWIERLPAFIRSAVHLFFSEKKRRESKYQVFLAFRGPDTRRGIAAYLYISLVAAGIRVFNDDDPSLIGKDFGKEISNAIDHCKISIPIFSPNYSSSRWCLDEVAQMVECKKTKGQKIMPIFYRVEPSHVRDISHCFKDCMLRHKELVDGTTYERWERALKEVGSTPSNGWESEKVANGHEGVLVKQVVKVVSSLLNKLQTHDPPSLSTGC